MADQKCLKTIGFFLFIFQLIRDTTSGAVTPPTGGFDAYPDSPTYCSGLPCAVGSTSCGGNPPMCQCDSPNVGVGRVRCVDPGSRCTCIALADPNYWLFDPPQKGKVNIPCSETLVKDVNLGASGCQITNIVAHPQQRGPAPDRIFRTFIGSITGVMASTSSSPTSSFTIPSAGAPTIANPASGLTSGQNGGFGYVGCSSVWVALNGTYGGALVDMPNSPAQTNIGGFCGNCDGTTDEGVNSDPKAVSRFLQNLAPAAQQQGAYASTCQQLSNGLIDGPNCNVNLPAQRNATIETIASICGRFLDEDFGLCLIKDTSVTNATDFDSLNFLFMNCGLGLCYGLPNSLACRRLFNSTQCSYKLPPECA